MTEEAKLIAKVETKGAKRASDELENFAKSADDADKSNESLQKTLKAGAAVFKASAAFIATTATAATALAVKSANAQREWNQLALTARDNVDDFKAAAFATEQVGISAEKLSDISKDTLEKLGEFIATGGGGFKDFFEQVAPLVDLTAQELQGLSGTEVLGRVQSAMEQANVPMELQSFYLESIASDTTKLIPLLADESAELNRLANSYKEVNEQLSLTSVEQKGLNDLAATFGLITDQAGNAATSIAATLAPTLDDFFGDVIKTVPIATQAVIDFINTFIDAENLSSIAAAEKRLASVREEIERLGESSKRGRSGNADQLALIRNKKEEAELEARITELKKEQAKLDQARTFAGSSIAVSGQSPNRVEETKTASFEIALAEMELTKVIEEETIKRKEARENDALSAKMQATATLSAMSNIFGSLASLQAEFGDRSSKEFKALFAAQQGFNIASAISAITTAAAQSTADPTAVTTAQKFANYAALISAITPTVAAINNAGNFANGGIVGGNSFTGDRMTANVNSGEMILNKQQQANLFAQANGAGSGGITIINKTLGRADSVTSSVASDGQLFIEMQQFLNKQVEDPNSDFNKRMQVTRRTQPLLP